MRTQLRQRMEAAQGAHRSESSVPSLPSGTGESASATPRRQPPPPPKAPARGTSTGANWGPCKQLPRQRMPRMEVGHPLPPGTHMSPPLRLRRRRTQLGQARPPHGRAEPLARRRLQGVLHLRQRSTSPRRRLSPKHGSWTKWRPGVCPSPVGGGPNHLDFASCRRSRLPPPLFPWVAWRQQSWRLTQSQLWLRWHRDATCQSGQP